MMQDNSKIKMLKFRVRFEKKNYLLLLSTATVLLLPFSDFNIVTGLCVRGDHFSYSAFKHFRTNTQTFIAGIYL